MQPQADDPHRPTHARNVETDVKTAVETVVKAAVATDDQTAVETAQAAQVARKRPREPDFLSDVEADEADMGEWETHTSKRRAGASGWAAVGDPAAWADTGYDGIAPALVAAGGSDRSAAPSRGAHDARVGGDSLGAQWGVYGSSNAKLRECHFLRLHRLAADAPSDVQPHGVVMPMGCDPLA